MPIPRFLVAELDAHIDGKEPEDLVFTGVRRGGPLRAPVFRAGFGAAAKAIGIPGLHPHELRHTAASLAIASGADVKVVQQMLGHSSAAMTMDVYGHLFHDRLDVVSDALDNACTEAAKAAEEGGRCRCQTRICWLPNCCQTPRWSTWRPRGPTANAQGQREKESGAPAGFEPAPPRCAERGALGRGAERGALAR